LVGAIFSRGARTNVFAASMGWRTPMIFEGENRRLCEFPAVLL
jgi:hypothetical protein